MSGERDERISALEQRVGELETALAYEAAVVEAQSTGVKALGKGRIRHLHQSVDRMRAMVRGEYAYYGTSHLSLIHARGEAETAALRAGEGDDD